VTFARPELPLLARFAFQVSEIAARDMISLWRAVADCRDGKTGNRECALPRTEAIVLLIALFFPLSAPVIRMFRAHAFSSAISMAFAVFVAY
jgi:hypothetical protein